MKAAQIKRYTHRIKANIVDVDIPALRPNEILVKVVCAGVNPLDVMDMTGQFKLIQKFPMPLKLGNEFSGVVEKVGQQVTDFKKGDNVYGLLPMNRLGSFAEYVVINERDLAPMPANVTFQHAATVPLDAMTAVQAVMEEMSAQAGQKLFMPLGNDGLINLVLPLAKRLGVEVNVAGDSRLKEPLLAAGVTQFIDTAEENYWEVAPKSDMIIDTIGSSEFRHELAVVKAGGQIVSLRMKPNENFAVEHGMRPDKRVLFSVMGAKYDRLAKEQNARYRFLFVRSDGKRLREITKRIQREGFNPIIDPHEFDLDHINDALQLVAKGTTLGKVLVNVSQPKPKDNPPKENTEEEKPVVESEEPVVVTPDSATELPEK